MLIVQPYLIRTRRNKLHKAAGTVSYLLVPLMVFTTIDLLKYRLSELPSLSTMDFFFVALVLNALIAFVIFYGLAIYHRKNSGLHARYMLCTLFPMFTPVTDRIIHIYFKSFVAYLPTIDGNPIAPVVGFVLADLMLIGLSIWDWLSHKRWNVFPIALIVLLGYHYSCPELPQVQFLEEF